MLESILACRAVDLERRIEFPSPASWSMVVLNFAETPNVAVVKNFSNSAGFDAYWDLSLVSSNETDPSSLKSNPISASAQVPV